MPFTLTRPILAMDFDGGYPTITEPISETESMMIEEIMIIGVQMKDADGLVAPFHIPPAVALAIVRMLCAMSAMRMG